MPSSKLSGRRATPKKPSVCISIPRPTIWSTTKAKIRVRCLNDYPKTPPTHLDMAISVEQIAPDSPIYRWDLPTDRPNSLQTVQLTAPLDPDYNALTFSFKDDNGQIHYSDNYFQPSRPVPFDQQVDCASYDYPDPDSFYAEITKLPT